MPKQKLPDIRAATMRLLNRREHSRLELKRKLLQRGFSSALIETTLDEFQEKNWQDDQRFAESYVRFHIERGDGFLKIQMKLRECGVTDCLIEQILPTDNDFWQQQLQRKWQKKCELITDDLAERAKHMRFLQSRGFTFEQISKFMKNIKH